MYSHFLPGRYLSKSEQSCREARVWTFLILLSSLLLMAAPSPDAWAQTEEFRVNSYTTGIQQWPDVTTFSDGGFVVVWQSRASPGTDSDGASVLARRFDSSASPLGEDFQVNTATSFDQTQAQVATLVNDGFVVVWNTASSPVLNTGETDRNDEELFGETGDINARIFDSSGNPIAAEFQINAPGELVTNYGHKVTTNALGGFAVVWDNLDDEVFFRPYDASGNPLASPVLLASDDCFINSWIDTINASVYLPLWHCHGSENTISFRRFDSTGMPLAAAQTAPAQASLALTTAVDNGFILASKIDGLETWSAQRFDSAGVPSGSNFSLSREILSLDLGPEGIATVWADGIPAGSDDDRLSIKRGRFSTSGATLSAESQVNVFTTHDQTQPDIAALPDGRFIVVWASPFSNDSDNNWSIRATILEDSLFADDFESGGVNAWTQAVP